MTRRKLPLTLVAFLLARGALAQSAPASAPASAPRSPPIRTEAAPPRPLPTAREVLAPASAPAPLPAAVPAPAPAAVDLPPGSVVGSVRFKGPEHEGERLDLPQAIRPVCGPFKRVFPYQVSQGSKLANAVVWIEGLPDPRPVPAEPVQLTLRRCEWQPELATARRGQVLVLANQDAETQQPLLRWQGADESQDVARRPLRMWIPARGQQLAVVLRSLGVAELSTAANRPWQRARVRVFDHGFHTTSGDRGDFEIAAVPAGSYTLHAWHPSLGEARQTVVVQSGRASSVSFTFTPEGPEALAASATPAPERAPQPTSAPAAGGATHAP